MNLNPVDDEYETRMIKFEIDCNDGKGEALACHQVGEFFSVVKDNHQRAAKVFEMNCEEKGYGPSCFNLGRLFLGGKGVPQSDAKALDLFHKSCTKNHLQGCHHEGMLLYLQAKTATAGSTNNNTEETIQTAQNKKLESLKKFDWACGEGEFESCHYIGSHYIDKKQLDRDPKKAIDYFTRACDANFAPSCYNLAVMFKFGDQGVEKNLDLFEKYKKRTNDLIQTYGGVSGTRTG